MAHSYPIWNEVSACHYKTSKSYGSKRTGAVNVYVGTSAKNSELLVSHFTTRREFDGWVVFRFGYEIPGSDPVVVTERWMNAKTREWLPQDTHPTDAGVAA